MPRVKRWPRNLPPILRTCSSKGGAENGEPLVYGLEVSPIYLHPETGDPFPRVSNELRRALSVSLRQFFYEFTRSSTTADPAHFHALGRRAVVKAVWEVDKKLAEVSDAFEFLLQLTPVNTQQAWHQFESGKFQRKPTLHYRPLLVDPVVLKRRSISECRSSGSRTRLWRMIFRQKLYELDRQITMFQDRNTPRFLHESIQLYGGVDDALYNLAVKLLNRIPPRSREASSSGKVNAEAFAQARPG